MTYSLKNVKTRNKEKRPADAIRGKYTASCVEMRSTCARSPAHHARGARP